MGCTFVHPTKLPRPHVPCLQYSGRDQRVKSDKIKATDRTLVHVMSTSSYFHMGPKVVQYICILQRYGLP